MPRLFRRPPQANYKVKRTIWLQNTSDQHIMLHLASGDLRLDKGHRQRFTPDVLENPQVKALLDAGQLAVQDA